MDQSKYDAMDELLQQIVAMSYTSMGANLNPTDNFPKYSSISTFNKDVNNSINMIFLKCS